MRHGGQVGQRGPTDRAAYGPQQARLVAQRVDDGVQARDAGRPAGDVDLQLQAGLRVAAQGR